MQPPQPPTGSASGTSLQWKACTHENKCCNLMNIHYLGTQLVEVFCPRRRLVVNAIVDVTVMGVVVCPHWRQHRESLPLCLQTFLVTQHVLVEHARVPTVEVHPKCGVAVRVDLQYRTFQCGIYCCGSDLYYRSFRRKTRVNYTVCYPTKIKITSQMK